MTPTKRVLLVYAMLASVGQAAVVKTGLDSIVKVPSVSLL